MKLKVLLGALVWTLLVSLAHLQLNIGWGELADSVREWFGRKRAVLEIGYLPVT